MIITKKYINDLREKSFMQISKDAEKIILNQFGSDVAVALSRNLHEYTEQDIWEQIKKISKEN